MRQLLDAERGERLDDNAFLAAVFQLALGAGSAEQGAADRARFQIVHYQCDTCGAAAQLGGGAKLAVSDAAIERAQCDAEHVTLDEPGRPTKDIPTRVRRFVMLRDGQRCRVPGCRASRFLEVHHVVHREDGGTHDPMNLIVLCDGHHKAHHDGTLWIGRTATALVVRRPGDDGAHVGASMPPASPGAIATTAAASAAPSALPAPASRHVHTGTSRFAQVELRTNAVSALKNLGWQKAVAGQSVDAALEELGANVPLEQLVLRALQLCR